jgi:hypothetical protein
MLYSTIITAPLLLAVGLGDPWPLATQGHNALRPVVQRESPNPPQQQTAQQSSPPISPRPQSAPSHWASAPAKQQQHGARSKPASLTPAVPPITAVPTHPASQTANSNSTAASTSCTPVPLTFCASSRLPLSCAWRLAPASTTTAGKYRLYDGLRRHGFYTFPCERRYVRDAG